MIDVLAGQLILSLKAKARVVRPRAHTGRQPSVSVVIPCYNYGHYLADCLQSVLDQQDVRLDLLVIDDASSDGSAENVRKLAATDSRIRAIFHATNQGHIATYNEGLAQVSGDYVVLLSADDLLAPGCLARATSLMEEYPSVGLTYGFPVSFVDGYVPPVRGAATAWVIWDGHDWIAQLCKTGGNALKSPEAVMRTSVLHKIGGYRPYLPHAADFELWMRAAVISDVGYVCGADQAYYREHPSSMHSSVFSVLDDFSQRLLCFDTIFDEQAASLPSADCMRDTARRAISRGALNYAICACAGGGAERDSIEDYVEFALKARPNPGGLGELRTLARLSEMSNDRVRRDPVVLAHKTMCNLRYRARYWRRRWVGCCEFTASGISTGRPTAIFPDPGRIPCLS
jgi:hypothetical protein